MPITYLDPETGYPIVAQLAPGVSAEQAAEAMNLQPGTWREITDEEAAELQQPTPEEIAEQEAAAAAAEKQQEAQEFVFGMMEGLGYSAGDNS